MSRDYVTTYHYDGGYVSGRAGHRTLREAPADGLFLLLQYVDATESLLTHDGGEIYPATLLWTKVQS